MPDVIDRIPRREGFVRRIVSEDEFHEMRERGWEPPTTSDGKHFQKKFTDRVAGQQFVVEMPVEKYPEYQHEYMGGKITEMQKKALLGKRDGKEGGEELVVENRLLPKEAGIRRNKER